jgi:hypothetical protein
MLIDDHTNGTTRVQLTKFVEAIKYRTISIWSKVNYTKSIIVIIWLQHNVIKHMFEYIFAIDEDILCYFRVLIVVRTQHNRVHEIVPFPYLELDGDAIHQFNDQMTIN